MGLRESTTKKPAVGIGIAILLLAVAVFGIWRQLMPATVVDTGVYFTDDDGKTWFKAELNHVPPFNHNGKQAVRCFLFESNGHQFAGYLRKYADKMRAKILSNAPCSDAELSSGTLVKKPGDSKWVPTSDPKSQQIMSPSDPDHPGAEVKAVEE